MRECTGSKLTLTEFSAGDGDAESGKIADLLLNVVSWLNVNPNVSVHSITIHYGEDGHEILVVTENE